MEKIFITGASGFVGVHLLTQLSTKPNLILYGIDIHKPVFTNGVVPKNFSFSKIDMQDKERLAEAIRIFNPDGIIHLASSSSVAYSWQNPVECFGNNTNIFLNLLEAVRTQHISCRILSVGSSEEYGSFHKSELPLTENMPVNPVSPYAVARVSQELLSMVYSRGYGLDIVMTRSFNHIGPGQDTRFFIPGFASQLMQIKKVESQEDIDKQTVIEVGDLSVIRDFTDVRDVIKAYWLLLNRGKKGEIYNVCSGTGYSLFELTEMMKKLAGVDARTESVSERMRPAENPAIFGSNEKIFRETGWKPEIGIEKSLRDVLRFWHEKN